MISLNGDVDYDLVVQLGFFRNIDLLNKGVYIIQIGLFYGMNGQSVIPVGMFSSPSHLDSMAHNQNIPLGPLCSMSEVDDCTRTLRTRSLIIRYKDEQYEMNDGIHWRLTLPRAQITPTSVNTGAFYPLSSSTTTAIQPLHLKFELLFTPFIDSENAFGDELMNNIDRFIPESPVYSVVAEQNILLDQMTSAVHQYYPIHFNGNFVVQLDCMIHGAVTSLKYTTLASTDCQLTTSTIGDDRRNKNIIPNNEQIYDPKTPGKATPVRHNSTTQILDTASSRNSSTTKTTATTTAASRNSSRVVHNPIIATTTTTVEESSNTTITSKFSLFRSPVPAKKVVWANIDEANDSHKHVEERNNSSNNNDSNKEQDQSQTVLASIITATSNVDLNSAVNTATTATVATIDQLLSIPAMIITPMKPSATLELDRTISLEFQKELQINHNMEASPLIIKQYDPIADPDLWMTAYCEPIVENYNIHIQYSTYILDIYNQWKSSNEGFVSSSESDASLLTNECILLTKKEQIMNEILTAHSIEEKSKILVEYINLSNTHLTLRWALLISIFRRVMPIINERMRESYHTGVKHNFWRGQCLVHTMSFNGASNLEGSKEKLLLDLLEERIKDEVMDSDGSKDEDINHDIILRYDRKLHIYDYDTIKHLNKLPQFIIEQYINGSEYKNILSIPDHSFSPSLNDPYSLISSLSAVYEQYFTYYSERVALPTGSIHLARGGCLLQEILSAASSSLVVASDRNKGYVMYSNPHNKKKEDTIDLTRYPLFDMILLEHNDLPALESLKNNHTTANNNNNTSNNNNIKNQLLRDDSADDEFYNITNNDNSNNNNNNNSNNSNNNSNINNNSNNNSNKSNSSDNNNDSLSKSSNIFNFPPIDHTVSAISNAVTNTVETTSTKVLNFRNMLTSVGLPLNINSSSSSSSTNNTNHNTSDKGSTNSNNNSSSKEYFYKREESTTSSLKWIENNSGSYTQSKRSSSAMHLIVLQHGFMGHAWDMNLIANAIRMELSNSNNAIEIFIPTSNEDKEQDCIAQMGKRLAFELLQFCKEFTPSLLKVQSKSKISFIGHSMGGLIIRYALQESMLSPLLTKLHSYISLATPHVGSLLSDSQLVSTGMWALFKFKKYKALKELVLEDAIGGKLQKSLLYKLSENNVLGRFVKVVLVCSPKDQYIPLYSARIQTSSKVEANEVVGSIVAAMVNNIISNLRADQLVRITMSNINIIPISGQVEEGKSSMNDFIGRTAHICYLENPVVARALILNLASFLT